MNSGRKRRLRRSAELAVEHLIPVPAGTGMGERKPGHCKFEIPAGNQFEIFRTAGNEPTCHLVPGKTLRPV